MESEPIPIKQAVVSIRPLVSAMGNSSPSTSSPSVTSSPALKRQRSTDLGYDSLHSTPKATAGPMPNDSSIVPLTAHLHQQIRVTAAGRSKVVTTKLEPVTTTTAVKGPIKRYLCKWFPLGGYDCNVPTTVNFEDYSCSPMADNNREIVAEDSAEEELKLMEPSEDDYKSPMATTTTATPAQPGREEWDQKLDFLLSIIGFAVDLSNVWRFPYLCYKNGGGVFLIPCLVMILFGALPLFFLELSLGQWAKSGPISVWNKICPPLKGIGYCFVLISWYVSFYYNVIIAWTTNYVIRTLFSGEEMPWQHCRNEYNTLECISMPEIRALNCRAGNTTGLQSTETRDICDNLLNRTSPTEEFFKRALLRIDQESGWESAYKLRPEMIGCLCIVFFVLYFSLFKGVKSSGKVVWVTATAPYVILTILLVRGLFLPGALQGIMYYIYPQVDKLYDPMVWVDAAVQVFYSIGVGFGVHLTYASFNKYHNNCFRDCLITASVNALTSFYSGFVIFTYLGYMAYSMDKDIANVASEGYGLVFQVYPEAISTLPFAKFWSLLFFVMLLTLGIDSAMGGLEAVITGITDEFNLKSIRREYFTAIVIGTSFLGALINCTYLGAYTMVWFDNYSAGISLILSATFEALAVVYIYGADKFSRDIEDMLGFPPHPYFIICWKYICPVFLGTITVMSVINSERITYYGVTYPMWATVAGWTLTLSSLSAIPVYLIIYYVKQKRTKKIDKINNHNQANCSLDMTNINEVKIPRSQVGTHLKHKDSVNNTVYV